MRVKLGRRQRYLTIAVAALFGILFLRLFYLQCVEGAELTRLALSQTDRFVYGATTRGSILDRYGRVLARTVRVSEVRLHPAEVSRGGLNRTILNACRLLSASGETLNCTLPLGVADAGAAVFYTPELSEFQTSLGLTQDDDAAAALTALREKLNIPSNYTPSDALKAAALLLAARDTRTVVINELPAESVQKLQQACGARFSRLMLQAGSTTGHYDVAVDSGAAESLTADDALFLHRAISSAGLKVACAPGSARLPIALSDTGAPAFLTPEIADLLEALGLDTGATAGDCVRAAADRFSIPEDTSVHDIIKVAAVRIMSSRLGTPSNYSILLASGVSDQTVADIKRKEDSLPGIRIEQGWAREYPQGALLSPVLGHIGRISAEQAELYAQLGYNINTDLVGRDGLEKQYETYLRGTPSVTRVEVDSWGRPVDEEPVSSGKPGQDILLTVDMDVQRAAEKALDKTMKDIRAGRLGTAYPNAKVGAAVAMDVRTGEVLCMASLPNYDPNLFSTGSISQADWEKLSPRYFKDGTLFEDPDPTLERPMVNNAVSMAFPPGSTFKMAVAVAGLAEGEITPGEQIVDKGRYTKYSTKNAPACWLYSGTGATHGAVDMEEALAVSCNYYFYTLGDRLGADAIEKYARELGLGQKTGIDLPGESAGSVDSAAYYREALKKKVSAHLESALPGLSESKAGPLSDRLAACTTLTQISDALRDAGVYNAELSLGLNDLIQAYRYRPANVLSSAIGQGGHTTTLLQMAAYTAQLANNGARTVPRLFAGTTNGTPGAPRTQTSGTLNVSQSVLNTVRAGMERVVTEGTAASAFRGCKLSVAGKTGSAQMSGKDACAWFVGYAPADDPQIAVAVLIAQGGQGTYAAPVGRAILEACFAQGSGDPVLDDSGLTP
jgi:penicillin-binding protein 2